MTDKDSRGTNGISRPFGALGASSTAECRAKKRGPSARGTAVRANRFSKGRQRSNRKRSKDFNSEWGTEARKQVTANGQTDFGKAGTARTTAQRPDAERSREGDSGAEAGRQGDRRHLRLLLPF